jgi:PhnB protein
MLTGDDSPESEKQELVWGNSVSIQVSAESKAEADRIFNALSAGGAIKMPIADVFWGEYFGYLKDRFGVWWTVAYRYPKTK